MRISLASIENDCNGFDAIAAVAEQTKHLNRSVVELNFHSCRFFEANMAAPLYTVVARLRDNLNEVSVADMTAGVATILRKNGFLSLFGRDELTDVYQTTLPFRLFKLKTEGQFNDYLEIHMKGKGIPPMSEGLAKKFRQSLLEIFSNASIHSGSVPGIFTCG